MTLKLTSIEEKQKYYVYGEQPYRMKDAPPLNTALEAAMREHGLDQQFRLTWGGVVIVREEPDAPAFVIARGSRDACHVINDVVLPKYPYVRAKQARGYCYTDALGVKHSGFTEESFVPPGYIAKVDYRYVEFGKLYWYLEELTSAETLVDTEVYSKNDVPSNEWECRMPLKATNGLYYEPGLEMIEILQQRLWENRNADLKEVGRENFERVVAAREEEETAEERAGKEEFDQLYDDISRQVERGTVYNIPYKPPVNTKLNDRLKEISSNVSPKSKPTTVGR